MKKILFILVLLMGTVTLTACCGSNTGCDTTPSYGMSGCCGDNTWGTGW